MHTYIHKPYWYITSTAAAIRAKSMAMTEEKEIQKLVSQVCNVQCTCHVMYVMYSARVMSCM